MSFKYWGVNQNLRVPSEKHRCAKYMSFATALKVARLLAIMIIIISILVLMGPTIRGDLPMSHGFESNVSMLSAPCKRR